MDISKQESENEKKLLIHEKKSVRGSSNICSKLTFGWGFNHIKTARAKEQLNIEDLGGLRKHDKI